MRPKSRATLVMLQPSTNILPRNGRKMVISLTVSWIHTCHNPIHSEKFFYYPMPNRGFHLYFFYCHHANLACINFKVAYFCKIRSLPCHVSAPFPSAANEHITIWKYSLLQINTHFSSDIGASFLVPTRLILCRIYKFYRYLIASRSYLKTKLRGHILDSLEIFIRKMKFAPICFRYSFSQ